MSSKCTFMVLHSCNLELAYLPCFLKIVLDDKPLGWLYFVELWLRISKVMIPVKIFGSQQIF